MDMKTLSRLKVQLKKDNIRAEIKIKLNKTIGALQTGQKEMKSKQPQKIRKRKITAENLKFFDRMSVFKEQSVGQEFQELFELEKKIGEGAHSVVYRCLEKKSGNRYAVKVTKIKDQQLMGNTRECYQILMELDCEQIIKGYYLYMSQSKLTCHLVCQLCEYPNLKEYMIEYRKQNKKTLPEQQAVPILCELLKGVQYLEKKGVCHRDIKPENILYDPEHQKLKLIDFQLARMERYTHQKLELLSDTGTLHYRAPETFKGIYGKQVDLWSVGIIAYQLLIGFVPFRSSSRLETTKKICNEEINFDYLELSIKAKHLLKGLLKKDAQKRIKASEALMEGFILKGSKKPPSKNERKYSVSYDDMDSNLNLQREKKSNMQSKCYYDQYSQPRFTHNEDIGVRIFSQK